MDERELALISSTLTIRSATAAEHEAVARLWTTLLDARSTYHASHAPSDDSVEAHVAQIEHWVGEGTAIVQVAIDASETIVGACVGRITPRPASLAEERIGRIEMIVVEPNHRDAGIGRTMLRAAVEDFRRAGVGRLEANICAENSDAIRFFERSRFELHTVTLSRDLGPPQS